MAAPISSPILSAVTAGDLPLKNRIVMAPITRSRSDDAGIVPDYAADYYARRAGAGLIVTEATNISPQARGYPRTPGIWSNAQIVAWRKVTEAVHRQGGKIMLRPGIRPEAPKDYWYGGDATGYSDWPGMAGPMPV